MLSFVEKILFAAATAASLYLTWRGVLRIIKNISSGGGKVVWGVMWQRIGELIAKVGLFQPVFKTRLGPSILHGLIGWGFIVFLLVNLNDLVYGYTGFCDPGAHGRRWRRVPTVGGHCQPCDPDRHRRHGDPPLCDAFAGPEDTRHDAAASQGSLWHPA